MEVYTLKQAARKAKIGVETLKRACEEGMIKATKLPNSQYRIVDEALFAALQEGNIFPSAPKRTGKRPQPEGLRKAQEAKRKAAKNA
jgi:hypothetical protein